MEPPEANSRFGPSSSSTIFFSAEQSPKSPGCLPPKDFKNRRNAISRNMDSLMNVRRNLDFESRKSEKTGVGVNTGKLRKTGRPSVCHDKLRNCDVYIGFHGCNPSLLRFTNWLSTELEIHGLICYITDRARCRNSRKHSIIERAMNACTYGVVILTKKSFRNPYTIDELRFFSNEKNLVPIYFDVGPEDCLVRDIIEKRGELWETYGGELWKSYGGQEKEWKDAVSSLSRVDEWKLEAKDGKWRDCIFRAVSLLAMRMGRRSIMDKLNKWREKTENEEFPFRRNENFVGREKELSRLELLLFGDGDKDYFELKLRRRKQRRSPFGTTDSGNEEENQGRRKGKEPVIWNECEKEIEMQHSGKNRRKSIKIFNGSGFACVSGEAGIGKTELLLEFAYRYQQMYKMVLWIGGESRYIRQNYLNLWSFFEIDVGSGSSNTEKRQVKSFEEQERSAVTRIRKQLMRNIPFLMIIDNLESEKDWWDHELIMDLLPLFGKGTHVIISTRLSSVMNVELLKLSYLSGVEALSLMQGRMKDVSVTEFDVLRAIEEKLGRLTIGLAIVGAILSELPIAPSRLLDMINRLGSGDSTPTSSQEDHFLSRYNFLFHLFEICFTIFDHEDEPRSLATNMVLASGWFAPSPIPISILALAAHKVPEKIHGQRMVWKNIKRCLNCCCFTSCSARRSESEASSVLLRFNLARSCTKEDLIQFNDLVKLYSRRRGIAAVAQAMVQAVATRGSVSHHSDHIWAACFLLLGFGKDPVVIKLRVQELLHLVKEVAIPLAIRTFVTFSRCRAAMELLRLSTEALEAVDQEFMSPVEKSWCWRGVKTNAQLNPCVWQELALTRANLLEVRAKLMARGRELDMGRDLIRKAIFIRSSICGEDHPDTVSAGETLTKITRLLTTLQNSP